MTGQARDEEEEDYIDENYSNKIRLDERRRLLHKVIEEYSILRVRTIYNHQVANGL